MKTKIMLCIFLVALSCFGTTIFFVDPGQKAYAETRETLQSPLLAYCTEYLIQTRAAAALSREGSIVECNINDTIYVLLKDQKGRYIQFRQKR
ncbi:hypothetical protein JW935_05935 [candidate division KSB1 bacterium]|nr:hypothetical protein [candidate division KSB1 bacterium]